MPRRARLMLPGVPAHIVHRGNNKQACFRQAQDRSFYRFHLTRLLPEAQCQVHAYCLMTNHVHLLVTAKQLNGCSILMKGIAQLHTQYMNRTYGRSGSLWEGRFRSCLVQAEDYVLACYRYIEMNPIRASLCRHPGEYEWSSFRANAEGVFDGLVTPHEEYRRLGQAEERLAMYRGLFEVTLSDVRLNEIRNATNGNFALGNASFRADLETRIGRRVAPGTPGRPSKENVVCP
jgi:putative transposase